MIRAVWDTNILASSVIARQGILAELVEAWRNGEFTVIVSAPISMELERTLRKPYFLARLTSRQRARFDALIHGYAETVSITEPTPDVRSQPADNLVLATAISAEAPYVVTGDREILALATFLDVRIVSARRFFEIVSRPAPEA